MAHALMTVQYVSRSAPKGFSGDARTVDRAANSAGETRGGGKCLNRTTAWAGRRPSIAVIRLRFTAETARFTRKSFMPNEHIGVNRLRDWDHLAPLYTDHYNVYERLLVWSNTLDRSLLDIRLKNKKADKEARSKAGAGRVLNTQLLIRSPITW